MTARPGRRSAFTLMELIVVIGIIVILAALAVKFLPNLDRHKGVPNAVTQLHGWVHLARLQAVRDGTGHGVRLIEDNPGSGRVTALQYIEQPDPIAPRGPFIRIDIRVQNGTTIISLYQDPTNTYNPRTGPPQDAILLNWEGVLPGDSFQLTGSPSVTAGIVAVTGPQNGAHKSAQLVLDRVIEGNDTQPYGSQRADGFRVFRQPQPLVGEPMLQMDKDVFIDLSRSHPCPPWVGQQFASNFQATAAWTPYADPNTGQCYLDILFNSSGAVANAPYGQIFLWVQRIDGATVVPPRDNILLGIFTRTGKVAPYSVFDVDFTQFDPYSNARQGLTPGL